VAPKLSSWIQRSFFAILVICQHSAQGRDFPHLDLRLRTPSTSEDQDEENHDPGRNVGKSQVLRRRISGSRKKALVPPFPRSSKNLQNLSQSPRSRSDKETRSSGDVSEKELSCSVASEMSRKSAEGRAPAPMNMRPPLKPSDVARNSHSRQQVHDARRRDAGFPLFRYPYFSGAYHMEKKYFANPRDMTQFLPYVVKFPFQVKSRSAKTYNLWKNTGEVVRCKYFDKINIFKLFRPMGV